MRKNLLLSFIAVAVSLLTCSAQERTGGVYILNEDWYGHNNSSLNFWNTENNQMEYYLIQHSNVDQSLGCTSQYAQIWNGRMYIMSKQDQDPGESRDITGGRLTVVNLSDMRIVKNIKNIAVNDKGQSIADGRGFCGVSKTKGYVGTSNGIYILDLNTDSITGVIPGTTNPLITGEESNADGQGPLYRNQIGMMINTAGRIFAIYEDRGILVIDPSSDEIVDSIPGCFSTMCLAKDGKIYAGTTAGSVTTYPYIAESMDGDGWVGTLLKVIDPVTLETSEIDLSPFANGEDVPGVCQTWYAWTAGSLCASATENVLYFTYSDPTLGALAWFNRCQLYKYDIDNNDCQLLYNAEETDECDFYGCDVRVRPSDGHLFLSLYPSLYGISTNSWMFKEMDADGNEISRITPTENFWYPALFLFPEDNATSSVNAVAETNDESTRSASFNLQGQRVSSSYKGITIRGGKKIIKK